MAQATSITGDIYGSLHFICFLWLGSTSLSNLQLNDAEAETKHKTSWLIAKLPVRRLTNHMQKHKVQIWLIHHRLHQQSKDAHCSRSFWACCEDAAVRTYFYQADMMLWLIIDTCERAFSLKFVVPYIEVWRYTDFEFDNVSSAKGSYQSDSTRKCQTHGRCLTAFGQSKNLGLSSQNIQLTLDSASNKSSNYNILVLSYKYLFNNGR